MSECYTRDDGKIVEETYSHFGASQIWRPCSMNKCESSVHVSRGKSFVNSCSIYGIGPVCQAQALCDAAHVRPRRRLLFLS